MRVRYALAAGFVVVVAALIFIRDEGYLGGRTEGGPLVIGLGGIGGGGPPGTTAGYGLMPFLEGDAVVIQRVRPQFKSPGLNFRAARILKRPPGCGACGYPRDGKLFVGSTYDGDAEAVVGMRAFRPGAYYALGLITDYKRGARRFRQRSEQRICHTVGPDARCGDVYEAPEDAQLVEIGGPSDYGVPVRDENGDLSVRLDGTRPLSLRIPITNVTGSAVEVSGVSITGGMPLRIDVDSAPTAFGLGPRAGRTVRLDLEVEGCLGEGSAKIFDRLDARVDGEPVEVPLTVALEVTADC